MRILLFIIFWGGLASTAYSQQKNSLGNITIEYHRLESLIFDNTRTLRVLLPEDYHRSGNDKKYKVLFMNDGQCLFNAELCPSSNQEWRIDETVDSLLAANAIEPLIIVGIDNIGIRYRGREYLPWEDVYLSPPIPNPRGSEYPGFLLTEVLPFIKDKYRISTERQDIGLGGTSYGALISLYTYPEKPKRIGFLLLESPSFYVNEKAIFKKLDSFEGPLPLKVHLGIGTNEAGLENCNESSDINQLAVGDAEALTEIFREKGLPEENMHFVIDKCATHTEKSYGGRFPEVLQFLFKEG